MEMYIGSAILMCSVSSTKVSFISVLRSSNGTQFLNSAFVFALPPVAVIFSLTKINASE